jgi:hypothetical protein
MCSRSIDEAVSSSERFSFHSRKIHAFQHLTGHLFMIEPIRATKLPQYAVLRAQLHHYEYIAQLAGQLGYESTVEQIHRRLNLMTDGQQYAVYVGEDLAGTVVG